MSNQTEKYIRTSISNYGNISGNTPNEFKSRNKRYLADRNKRFNSERAYLSSDYVKADVQGLQDDFYAYTSTNIRLANAGTLSVTSLTTKKMDDFKRILLSDLGIDYIPIGAKIKTMGSYWIVINPENISAPDSEAIIARCNASFAVYDEYGNIHKEPIVVEKTAMFANKNEKPINIEIMNGYFNITCQLNEYTEKLSENSRIILGKKAYIVTGYTDFIQEFTGDYDSCHVITFTARVDEPTENDDLINKIADGLNTVYSAKINIPESINVGNDTEIKSYFMLNNVELDLPCDWNYVSDDETVAKIVDDNIVGVGEGVVNVTATLQQNENITATAQIEVKSPMITHNEVIFKDFVPTQIMQYMTETVTASVILGGVETEVDVEFRVSGATADDYNIHQRGNSLDIQCISPSDVPITVTAIYENLEKSIEIELIGY